MTQTTVPSIVSRVPFRDIATVIISLKPGRSSLFVEEALAYGVRRVFDENPSLRQAVPWLFHGQSSPGSCGATHTALDGVVSSLHLTSIQYTSDYQYCRLTALGRDAVNEFRRKHGSQTIDKLKPLASEIWKRAREYNGMYNRPELYA